MGSSCRRLGIAAMGGTCCKRKGLGEGVWSPKAAVRGQAAPVLYKQSLRRGCGRSDWLIWRLSSVELRVVDGLCGWLPSHTAYSS